MHAREDQHGGPAATQRGRRAATTPPRATALAPPGAPLPVQMTALQHLVGNRLATQVVQRRRQAADRGHPPATPPVVQRSAVHDVLRSPGRPLDHATRGDMEARLGADFSDVRVHDNSSARASAAELGARAYTSGNHIVIGDGGADRHTLAHELTHVIQQRRGPVAGIDNGGGLRISDPSDRFEREAEANAHRALSAPPRADVSSPTGSTATASEDVVQRMPRQTREERENEAIDNAASKQLQEESGFLDRPTLTFTSQYVGPTQQVFDANHPFIGFSQAATLHNPPGAVTSVADNYHFCQRVTDMNVQHFRDKDGRIRQRTNRRPWAQDGQYYQPPYEDTEIDKEQNLIRFRDQPGFSGNARMAPGCWVSEYTISFVWRVKRNRGKWKKNQENPPYEESPVMTHTLSCPFDPDNPVPIRHQAAGPLSWTPDLSGT